MIEDVSTIIGDGNILATAVFVVAYLYSLPVIIYCARQLYAVKRVLCPGLRHQMIHFFQCDIYRADMNNTC